MRQKRGATFSSVSGAAQNFRTKRSSPARVLVRNIRLCRTAQTLSLGFPSERPDLLIGTCTVICFEYVIQYVCT